MEWRGWNGTEGVALEEWRWCRPIGLPFPPWLGRILTSDLPGASPPPAGAPPPPALFTTRSDV
ncbi:MAG: hypothetical protein VKP63_00675 [Cyanobacteriota bacterium]|nr:hypothetical protein [Cyanobacteriota bacterium]